MSFLDHLNSSDFQGVVSLTFHLNLNADTSKMIYGVVSNMMESEKRLPITTKCYPLQQFRQFSLLSLIASFRRLVTLLLPEVEERDVEYKCQTLVFVLVRILEISPGSFYSSGYNV
jgi:hypothetical protein